MRREIHLSMAEVIHHGLDPSAYEWTPRPDEYVAFGVEGEA